MWKTIRFAMVFALFIQAPMSLPAQVAQVNSTRCAVVEEGLQASRDLKRGMTRSDVERAFEIDGGLNFREKTYYVFKKCPFLKIDVEFTIDSKVERTTFAPTDTIKSVSKMYVDYQHKD